MMYKASGRQYIYIYIYIYTRSSPRLVFTRSTRDIWCMASLVAGLASFGPLLTLYLLRFTFAVQVCARLAHRAILGQPGGLAYLDLLNDCVLTDRDSFGVCR